MSCRHEDPNKELGIIWCRCHSGFVQGRHVHIRHVSRIERARSDLELRCRGKCILFYLCVRLTPKRPGNSKGGHVFARRPWHKNIPIRNHVDPVLIDLIRIDGGAHEIPIIGVYGNNAYAHGSRVNPVWDLISLGVSGKEKGKQTKSACNTFKPVPNHTSFPFRASKSVVTYRTDPRLTPSKIFL